MIVIAKAGGCLKIFVYFPLILKIAGIQPGEIAGKIIKLLIFKINDRFAAIIIATGRSYGQIIVLKQGEIRFALKTILFIVLLKNGLTVIIFTAKVLIPPLQGNGDIPECFC